MYLQCCIKKVFVYMTIFFCLALCKQHTNDDRKWNDDDKVVRRTVLSYLRWCIKKYTGISKDGNSYQKNIYFSQHALNYFIEHFSFIQFIVNFVKLPSFPSYFCSYSWGKDIYRLLYKIKCNKYQERVVINWIFLFVKRGWTRIVCLWTPLPL